MSKSKLSNLVDSASQAVTYTYHTIEETVVNAYKSVQKAACDSYQNIEQTVVDGYTKVEDAFVDRYLTKDGESTEQAKQRLKKNSKQD